MNYNAAPNTIVRLRNYFYATYTLLPTFREACAIIPNIWVWPTKEDCIPGVEPPPVEKMREWAEDIDSGKVKADDRILKICRQKLDTYLESRHSMFLQSNMEANEQMLKKVVAGDELTTAHTATLQHTSNAANYGIKQWGDTFRGGSKGGAQTINAGNVTFITNGPKMKQLPKKESRLAKQVPKQIPMNAEFTVVE